MRYLIGIGNYHARDDSIGLRIAEAIGERGIDRGFRTVDLGGNLLDLVHYLGPDSEQVLVVDSARMGREPGEYVLFTPDQVVTAKPIEGLSTHEGDLIKVLEFAAALGEPLAPVTIMGIEPGDVRGEPGLSPALQARFDEYIEVAVEFITDSDVATAAGRREPSREELGKPPIRSANHTPSRQGGPSAALSDHRSRPMAPRVPGTGTTARHLLLSGRPDAVTDTGLLSVVMGEPSGRVVESLLAEHPIPDALWRVCGDDLCALEGVGPAAAARVLACLEMSRRASAWRCSPRTTISTPEDVVALCAAQFRGLDREHFWCLSLNTKNRLLRMAEVSIGSLNASIVHPRELFKEAVKMSAASIVLVHNHPTGDPTPSGADVQLTRRLVKAGDVLGIEVLDHVVIGDGGEHSSLRDMGLM